MQEFLAADIVVIGVAFYNFSISSQLKAWIDRIAIAGKTFRYTASGQLQGLAGNKRVILAIARGGFFEPWLACAGDGARGNLPAYCVLVHWRDQP